MISHLHGGKGVNVSTSVQKFSAPLLLSSLFSGFCYSFLVSSCFFQYVFASVGNNSVCKCVNSGRLHISIGLLGKVTHKNMSTLVSGVGNSFSATSHIKYQSFLLIHQERKNLTEIVKKAEQVNTELASYCDHINIRTKLQNNHH